MLTPPPTYAALRRAVETAMVKGMQAVELAKVRTYHETGRLISAHLLLHQARANYGARTLRRLAEDTKVDVSVLHRCVGFYRAFPIVAPWPQLSWAHYRLLIPVADGKLRRTLATEANRHAWPVARLEQRIRFLLPAGGAEHAPAPALLDPRQGKPGICRVIDAGAGPVVDLGFACYLELPAKAKFAPDALVTVGQAGNIFAAPDATKDDLFTYAAEVLRVVDGDTLQVKIHLHPALWIKQKLRLRDLDCPEMDTPEGQAAKQFVETQLARADRITISTTKPDKYDRYLADVFLHTGDATLFLNNELLTHRHANRKSAYKPADWESA